MIGIKKGRKPNLQECSGKWDGLSDCQAGRRDLLSSLHSQKTKPVCGAHNWWCVFMAPVQPVVLGAILTLDLSLGMSACPALECVCDSCPWSPWLLADFRVKYSCFLKELEH